MLQAYAVTEHCENTGGIVFANSDIEARKRGASEYADGEITEVSCKRAPWADQYAAAGRVPVLVMIEYGWWWTCNGCERTVTSDFEDYDDDDVVIDLHPVEDARGFWCTPECRDRDLRERAERKIFNAMILDHLRMLLAKRLPGAIAVENEGHVYAVLNDGLWTAQQARIDFRFPGCVIAPASFRLGCNPNTNEIEALVCAGDLEAYKAWRATATQEKEIPNG